MGYILRFITLPFAWGVRGICNVIETGMDKFRSEEKKVDRFVGLLPIIAVIYAIVMGIVSIITFAVSGGYKEPFEVFKKDTWLAANNPDGFTSGNVGNFYSRSLIWVFVLLIFLSVVYVIVTYIKNETGFKRVVFIFFSTILTIALTFMTIAAVQCIKTCDPDSIFHFADHASSNRENIYKWICKKADVIFIGGGVATQVLSDCVLIAVLICTLIIWLMAKFSYSCSEFTKEITDSFYVYAIFCPIVVYSVENIFGIGSVIFALLLITVLTFVFGGFAGASMDNMANSIEADRYRKEAMGLVKEAQGALFGSTRERKYAEAREKMAKANRIDRR